MPDQFRFTILATDIVVFAIRQNVLHVLLVNVKQKPYQGLWAVPGGLVSPNEAIEAAATRYLQAAIGKGARYFEQLYTFGRVDRDPKGRIVSVSYYALMPEAIQEEQLSDLFTELDWFPLNQLPDLAYDHSEVISFALERLQGKVTYSNIIYGLLPDEFSLGELQAACEIVLGRQLDKRNFRRKIIALELLEKTERMKAGLANRPAALYRFRQTHPVNIPIL